MEHEKRDLFFLPAAAVCSALTTVGKLNPTRYISYPLKQTVEVFNKQTPHNPTRTLYTP